MDDGLGLGLGFARHHGLLNFLFPTIAAVSALFSSPIIWGFGLWNVLVLTEPLALCLTSPLGLQLCKFRLYGACDWRHFISVR